MAYVIKYYRKGFWVSLIPSLFPDGTSIITHVDNADEAIKRFEEQNRGYKVYDIRKVK